MGKRAAEFFYQILYYRTVQRCGFLLTEKTELERKFRIKQQQQTITKLTVYEITINQQVHTIKQ